jgi:hypothetical protein
MGAENKLFPNMFESKQTCFRKASSENYKNKKVKDTINFSYSGCQGRLWHEAAKEIKVAPARIRV